MRRLSSAAMQPSIACASPGARVQEQSTCALLLLHHDAERRFAWHQVRRRACEQLQAGGHTPEQLPERNLCTYTGSAVRCLFSTAMMPSLARTTSAVCSLPGAHAHTRSVVCLCWRRGVMLTLHKSRCVLGFLHARHAVSSHVPTTQPSRARTSPGARRRTRTQELPCAASPPRQCCQHDSQATRRAAARCPHGDMRAHAGAAVDLRVVSSPRISIGPAGSRINRDHARRGWATETGHPSWGPPTGTRDKTSCARLLPHDAADAADRGSPVVRCAYTHASDRDCVSSPHHRVHIAGTATCCFSAGRRRCPAGRRAC